jgi:hypothetical protein
MADPTPLEQALATAHADSNILPAVTAFMNGRVIVAGLPTAEQPGSNFQPLVISNGTTGFLCVFSSTERIAAMLGATPDHVFAEMIGLDVVRNSTEGLGIAINPGSEQGMEFGPEIVTALKGSIQ